MLIVFGTMGPMTAAAVASPISVLFGVFTHYLQGVYNE
jgi:hypothetical protein